MKKILAVLVAVVLVAAMTVSAFAFDGSADISLYVQNQGNWVTAASDPVTVNADGEYTVKLTGLSINPDDLTVIYVKDVLVYSEEKTASDLPADIKILTKSIKINGEEVPLKEGYATTLTDAGAFDVCWYNIWDVHYITIDTAIITDVEVTFEVVTDGAAAPAPEADTTPTPEAAPEATTAPAAETPAAPAAPKTGVALAVVPMVLAAAAVAIAKRR